MKTSEKKETFSPICPHDYICKIFEGIEKRHTRRNQKSDWSSGIHTIDELFGGFHSGDLIVLTGYTGNLKSSLLIQLLVHANVVEHKTFLALSTVFNQQQYLQRLLASAAKLPLARITGGTIRDQDWPDLTRGVGRMTNQPYFFHTSEDDRYRELINEGCEEFILEKNIDILVIDPLPMTVDPSLQILQNLKHHAQKLNVTVFAVIDILPEAEQNGKPEFNISPLFSKIEALIDGLCFIHKEMIIYDDYTCPTDTLVLQNFGIRHRVIFSRDRHQFIDFPEIDGFENR